MTYREVHTVRLPNMLDPRMAELEPLIVALEMQWAEARRVREATAHGLKKSVAPVDSRGSF